MFHHFTRSNEYNSKIQRLFFKDCIFINNANKELKCLIIHLKIIVVKIKGMKIGKRILSKIQNSISFNTKAILFSYIYGDSGANNLYKDVV